MIKTVSLETAKLLKENGFRQDTHYLWIHTHSGGWIINSNVSTSEAYRIYSIAAPTTDELLEELPAWIKQGQLQIVKHENAYIVVYSTVEFGFQSVIENKSLPEALAQMWLHLKKEGLNDMGKL